MSSFRIEMIEGPIAVLVFDQPNSRANTLSSTILEELRGHVAELRKKTDLVGMILMSGKPGMFIAGADLKELGSANLGEARIRELTQRGLDIFLSIEDLPYPTLAAIEGACMGGGLELALGCDLRLASDHPKTDIGLPEVKVGLIPGWGGTQRLSRVIGPALAAELICAGDTVKGQKARELGLVFDVVPSAKLRDEAVRVLKMAKENGMWQENRRKKKQPVGLTEEQQSYFVETTRGAILAKTKGQLPAPLAALEAIARGCNKPLNEGLQEETKQFLPLVGSTISRNLIAVFFMSQRVAKDTGVNDPNVKPRDVKQVGVIGAGIMGAGIAAAYIRKGIPTIMLDTIPQALEKGAAGIAKGMQSRVDAGKMAAAEMTAALGKLTATSQLNTLADRDVAVEAIIENEDAKTKLYAELQKILPADAILASNTSTISITRMAKVWHKPENFAGMHFFNPVDKMPLVEVIRGEKTSDETVATLVALAKRVGKSPIVVRDCPGFLVNRILFPYLNEALVLLEEGAEARTLDKVATDFGMPMGPITLNDVVGLDTSLFASNVIATAFTDRAMTPDILKELVAAKRLGQKSGAGYYSYAKGPRGIDDPTFTPILDKCRKGRREIGAEEIGDRMFLAMLTEACRVVEEGIVRDPVDADMGLILGIGFPTFRGGLLRWADTLGMPAILDKLKKYEKLGRRFEPTDGMKDGKRFFAD